jgi:hypothetical protein
MLGLILKLFTIYFSVLRTKFRVLLMLTKYFTTEIPPQPLNIFKDNNNKKIMHSFVFYSLNVF